MQGSSAAISASSSEILARSCSSSCRLSLDFHRRIHHLALGHVVDGVSREYVIASHSPARRRCRREAAAGLTPGSGFKMPFSSSPASGIFRSGQADASRRS